jgi:PadR family transcriptional regulator, regulatory protein AphA
MRYFEAPTDPTIRYTPQDLVGACYERDVWNVLFDEGALPPEFFDLKSGFAGEVMQKLANYGIRAGVVIPDMSDYSDAFRDFARETNRSGSARFFRNGTDAISWLSKT